MQPVIIEKRSGARPAELAASARVVATIDLVWPFATAPSSAPTRAASTAWLRALSRCMRTMSAVIGCHTSAHPSAARTTSARIPQLVQETWRTGPAGWSASGSPVAGVTHP